VQYFPWTYQWTLQHTSLLRALEKASGSSTSDFYVAIGNEFNGIIKVFIAHGIDLVCEELHGPPRVGRACGPCSTLAGCASVLSTPASASDRVCRPSSRRSSILADASLLPPSDLGSGARADHAAHVCFLECAADELRLCEVRELLREYRQVREGRRGRGRIRGQREGIFFGGVPTFCECIYGAVATKSRPVKM
jgi:hypothetical protein